MRKLLIMTRSIIAALTLAILFGGSAFAQNAAPALKARVTVTSNVVRIGDLVENAGPVADVAIFRAPDLGTTGAVSTDRIVDAIRPHELIGIDTRGIAEVLVTRASRSIGVPEIANSVAQALAGQYNFGDAHNIQVNFDHDVRTLQIEPTATGALQVVALAYDPRTARFDVTFGLPSSAELRRQSAHYSGTATETVDAVTVTRPVERGEVLKPSDLVMLRRPKTEIGLLTGLDAVAGLAARRPLRPGQPLAPVDVMKPEIVQRNDTVTIVYQAPGVTLTLRGQAHDAGALGDAIGVLNMESKRVVQAVVSGPDRVTVSAITTRVVDSGTASAE
jgi:flagellar basal body P-ring formation protein FlgA